MAFLAAEGVLQTWRGTSPDLHWSGSSDFLGLVNSFSNGIVSVKGWSSWQRHLHNRREKIYCGRRFFSLAHKDGMTNGSRSESVFCRCQRAEGISGLPVEKQRSSFGAVLNHVNKGLESNGSPVQEMIKDKKSSNAKSVEDEAWDLLREAIVYYCNTPVGTIAANDPSSTSILNYDQVFIRDFVPSGIAFLLKGEYDIVRNFIVHTLQLQV